MLDDIFEDSTFTKEVQEKVEETQLMHELVKQRIKSGKSQADVAKVWGCNVSTISRFESKDDKDIKLGELVNYCDAIGTGVGVHIASPVHNRAAALINCVTQIDNHLKELSRLAAECNDDDVIVKGITKFQAEILLQIMKKASKHTDDIVERIDLVKPSKDVAKIESNCELVEI